MKLKIKIAAVVITAIAFLSGCREYEMNYVEFESTQKQDGIIVAETNVSANDASLIASKFMAEQLKGSSSTKANNQSSLDFYSVKTFSQDGKNLMHMVSYDNGGFVLVSATKDYYPVLAFCDEGDFNIDELNEGQKFWLEMTKAAINNCDKLDDSTKADINTVWKNYERSDINTLFHSATKSTMSQAEEACWDRCFLLNEQYGSQGWIFMPLSEASQIVSSPNYSIHYQSMCNSAISRNSPIDGTIIGYKHESIYENTNHLLLTNWYQTGHFGSLCPNGKAGCGAIAVGQIMKYYNYPSTITYQNDYFSLSSIPIQMTYSSKQDVFIARVRDSLHTSPNGVTDKNNIKPCLEKDGYSVNRSSHNPYISANQIIDSQKPVLMVGFDDSTGHTWICDGAKKQDFNRIITYCEWQSVGTGTFYTDFYTMSNPITILGTLLVYFQMNWGQQYPDNTWYFLNPNSINYDGYQYYLEDFYITKP